MPAPPDYTSISNCVIAENRATYGASALYCIHGAPTIANNTIVSNFSPQGGASVYCQQSSPVLVNNIVAFNCSGISLSEGVRPPVRLKNVVYGNRSYNIPYPEPVAGDISIDPVLGSNYHLQPSSPCIDAGDDTVVQPGWTDIDGQARVQGVHVDIGADESDGTLWDDTPTIVRVSPNGDDSNDGSTWALARKTIQGGIDTYSAQHTEIWVAGGVYKEKITLASFAKLYGGFAGTETDKTQRDWVSNPTVLDGEGAVTGSMVTIIGFGDSNTIDGFTIKNSGVNGGKISCDFSSPTITNCVITEDGESDNRGWGIRCFYSSPTISNCQITRNRGSSGGGIYCRSSSPVITECIIEQNTASADIGYGGYGGGIYCDSSSMTISHCLITANNASWSGGGMMCGYSSQLTMSKCIIEGNAGKYAGGACISESSCDISNCVITGNSASINAGGILFTDLADGAMYNCSITRNAATGHGGGVRIGPATINVFNCVIAENSADYGAGLYCWWSPSAVIYNNTITGNNGRIGNGGVYCESCSPVITNNIIAFNSSGVYTNTAGTPTLRNNCVYGNISYNYSGLQPGEGDISQDPLLTAAYRLQPSSPCINAGNNEAVQPGWLDMDGEPRIFGPSVDIGADEYQGTPVVCAPTFSPDGGTYPSTQSVTIACSTLGAVIHYTTDGSEPTEGSTVVSGPVVVDKSLTLKAKAWKDGWDANEIKSAFYSITTIANAKSQPDGVLVQINGVIVTAVFGDSFYVETTDRSSGVRVNKAGHLVGVGDMVDVSGYPVSEANGELSIAAETITSAGSGTIEPLGMSNASLGGVAFGRQRAIWGWRRVQKDDGSFELQWNEGGNGGLSNIGLLVRTWGKVKSASGNSFIIDDGSGNTVKCIAPSGVTVDPDWRYVTVTGISSCENVVNESHEEELRRVLLVRMVGDIAAF